MPRRLVTGAPMKRTWFDGVHHKSPLIPLYERGKSSTGPPLCKGETEGISYRR
jgi:hypothetical protein